MTIARKLTDTANHTELLSARNDATAPTGQNNYAVVQTPTLDGKSERFLVQAPGISAQSGSIILTLGDKTTKLAKILGVAKGASPFLVSTKSALVQGAIAFSLVEAVTKVAPLLQSMGIEINWQVLSAIDGIIACGSAFPWFRGTTAGQRLSTMSSNLVDALLEQTVDNAIDVEKISH